MRSIFNILKTFMINRSLKCQNASNLYDLYYWGMSYDSNNKMSVAGLQVQDLLKQYGSPLLVVNKERLVEDALSVQNAINRCGRSSKVTYSYKTNCIPGILKELHDLGIGAEVISPYELWLAEQLEVPSDNIIYNGVNKTEESLFRAIDMDILSINIDSLSEVETIVSVAKRLEKKARVGMRLAFSQSTQFGLGIDTGEAMEAFFRIMKYREWIEMVMLHFSVTSNSRDSSTHCHYAQKALEFAKAVKDKIGLTICYLDVGGGIGVPTSKNMSSLEYGLYRLFGCLPKPPDPNDFENIGTFISRIQSTVESTCKRLHLDVPSLIVEPGRFVTSRGEFLLSTVQSVKKKTNGARFVITDAGRLSITYPMDFEYHAIFTAQIKNGRQMVPQNLMGRICTSADWMAKNVLLPELEEGDVLATMDAGAYFSSYSSNFSFGRPAIVMVNSAGAAKVLREAENFEHLVAMDTLFK
ncbi:diaminopimelate decarboxylase family protein [Desulfatitalea alkaliphila]|uniref:Diaminopimelate decarboxylase n=1 Tax=Desulfatitalea alkaliphila TaxID=2929485 RepID=A0AA41UL47_9BACT|nr:hypothetical protein [Desulfatitalea alkaliphila]MCJ8503009.1 hypothetical protein [Desulfatitalea alkaliphila]